MAAPLNQDHPKAWQRFTLLDLLLLHASFAVGLSITSSVRLDQTGWVPPIALASAFDVDGWIHRVVGAAMFGCVVAGPLVLLGQWLWQGRRTPLSVGEWLWLGSGVYWAFLLCLFLALSYRLWIFANVDPLTASYLLITILFSPWLVAVVPTACVLAALPRLIEVAREEREPVPWRPVPCRWTHWFGAAVSVLWAAWLWYLILAG